MLILYNFINFLHFLIYEVKRTPLVNEHLIYRFVVFNTVYISDSIKIEIIK